MQVSENEMFKEATVHVCYKEKKRVVDNECLFYHQFFPTYLFIPTRGLKKNVTTAET